MTDDRPREFLQLSDGRYVRVTSADDGELVVARTPRPCHAERSALPEGTTRTSAVRHVSRLEPLMAKSRRIADDRELVGGRIG